MDKTYQIIIEALKKAKTPMIPLITLLICYVGEIFDKQDYDQVIQSLNKLTENGAVIGGFTKFGLILLFLTSFVIFIMTVITISVLLVAILVNFVAPNTEDMKQSLGRLTAGSLFWGSKVSAWFILFVGYYYLFDATHIEKMAGNQFQKIVEIPEGELMLRLYGGYLGLVVVKIIVETFVRLFYYRGKPSPEPIDAKSNGNMETLDSPESGDCTPKADLENEDQIDESLFK